MDSKKKKKNRTEREGEEKELEKEQRMGWRRFGTPSSAYFVFCYTWI